MQYIVMFMLCVIASIADVLTGICKAYATTGYDSTIMRKGLYGKAVNLTVMAFAIAVEIGLELLGNYYQQEQLAKWTGAITAGFVFTLIILMESISIAENFAQANPKSPLAKVLAKKLKKIGKDVEKSVESVDNSDTENPKNPT
jgi:phage-related holin